jgi:hypothetical protein
VNRGQRGGRLDPIHVVPRIGNRHQRSRRKELSLPVLKGDADDLVSGAGDEQHRFGSTVLGTRFPSCDGSYT